MAVRGRKNYGSFGHSFFLGAPFFEYLCAKEIFKNLSSRAKRATPTDEPHRNCDCRRLEPL